MAANPNPPLNNKPRLLREMVAAQNVPFSLGDRQILPPHPDDITRELGLKVYEAMLCDPQISATTTLFKASVLEDGCQILPSVSDPNEDGASRSRELVDELKANLDELPVPFDDVLWDMLNHICFGSKVGEMVWRVSNNKLLIDRIKPKPVRSVGMVVDEFMNLTGIIGAKRNQITPIVDSVAIAPNDILPLEKFLIFTFRPRDSDPRGTSILRPAYGPWWNKVQLRPEYMKWLSQFAGGSVIGYTPEDASMEDAVDPDTGKTVTPEEAMLQTLLKLRNGSAAAFPGGSKIEFEKSEGDGVAFTNANADFNLEITKAILGQELATEQSKYMARAAATVHQDVLDTLIRQGKLSVVRAIYQQFFRRWVLYNYGESELPLTPIPSLGTVEQQDLSRLMLAIAALMRAQYITPEQKPAIDKLLGFPVRPKEAIAAELEQRDAAVEKAKNDAKPQPAPTPAPQQQNNNNNQPNAEPNDSRAPNEDTNAANNANQSNN